MKSNCMQMVTDFRGLIILNYSANIERKSTRMDFFPSANRFFLTVLNSMKLLIK